MPSDRSSLPIAIVGVVMIMLDIRLLPIAVIVDDGNGYRSMYVHL